MSEVPIEKQLYQVAAEALYLQPDVIKFLLTENLALKTLLLEKGVLTLEDYKAHQKKAADIVENLMKAKLAEQLKRAVTSLKTQQAASEVSASVSPEPPRSEQ